MNEIDERLNYIRERVDAHAFHNARADLSYLLELVTDLRHQLATHDAEASAACQEWDIKCQALAQKCDELKVDREYNAGLVIERDAMLATVTALVPEADWLEEVAYDLDPRDCVDCYLQELSKCDGRSDETSKKARAFAARIRVWREEGGGCEEGEKE